MNITLLDDKFNDIEILDTYTSFIWTDRYRSYGDFELYAPVNTELYEKMLPGYYLKNDESEHLMIIEKREITTDVEEGDMMKITGRSLESILDRRIVWAQTNINSDIQTGIISLLNDAIINPQNSDRQIPGFYVIPSDDPDITGISLEAQYTGDNIYDIIVDLCAANKFGFKITLDDDRKFVFQLYNGIDRSAAVIFANEFNNLTDTDFVESYEKFKNITLVAGEGEGTNRKTRVVGSGSGLSRKELYTDARDISSTSSGSTISAAVYNSLLEQRGKEKLAELSKVKEFNGSIAIDTLYTYGVDYNIGDLIYLIDKYGNEGTARIDEIIFSHDGNEYKRYPTFTIQDEEGIQ